MTGVGLKILKSVSKKSELSLLTTIEMAKASHGNHLDQYPLALLLEEGYLGMTTNYEPPSGMEEMREFALAITLHMFTLAKDKDGVVSYQAVKSTGGMDPSNEKVFIKAKGALYLDEQRQRLTERLWSFFLGLTAGILVALAAAWIKQILR